MLLSFPFAIVPAMKILVTGSQGQIGHELLRTLEPLGHVTGIDIAELDLTAAVDVKTFLGRLHPDLIINCAAYTAVDRAETEHALAQAVNVAAVEILAREAAQLGAAVVHYSTDYVFDGTKPSPYTPDDTPIPQSVYGRSKLAGEQALIASGAKYLILRTEWVYGLRGRNFVLAILDRAQQTGELRVVNDQTGSPTWCRTVAQVTTDIVRASLEGKHGERNFGGREGVYHVTCEGQTTWFDFAKHIFNSRHVSARPRLIPVSTAEFGAKAARPANSVLDCTLTEKTFGVKMPPWQSAIDAMLAERDA
jgi:dTDP-4-dehydrorhamnose reductase